MTQQPAAATRYIQATRGDVVFMKVVRWLTDHGVSLLGSRVLTVRGRKTGTPQSCRSTCSRSASERFLVAPRGNTQWVRNVRAAGEAQLRVGAGSRPSASWRCRPTSGCRCSASTSSGGAGRSAGSSRASPRTPPTPRLAAAAPGMPVFRLEPSPRLPWRRDDAGLVVGRFAR